MVIPWGLWMIEFHLEGTAASDHQEVRRNAFIEIIRGCKTKRGGTRVREETVV